MTSRSSAWRQGYDSTWRRLRQTHLHNYPLCRDCERHGLSIPARHVDHITPIKRGGSRLDPTNLQSLCESCHNRKSARESHGLTMGHGCDSDGAPLDPSHPWNMYHDE